MRSIAIVGSNGFLGTYLSHLLAQDQSVLKLNRGTSEKSVSQKALIDFWKREILDKPRTPEVLINCAAMTAVSECESDPDSAFEVNGKLPGTLAEICSELGIFMLQISTDAVYGGSKAPSHELTEPVPLSVYAKSKLEGESRALGASDALILRVNFFGRNPRAKSVFDYFSQDVSNARSRVGFSNVITTSVHISTLAENIKKISEESVEERLHGILNLGTSNSMSKYDFGSYIAKAKGLNSPEKGLFQAPYLSSGEIYDLSMDSSVAKQHGLSVPTMQSEIDKAIRLG